MPRKAPPLRIERLSPPEITGPEIDIYHIAMAEGIVQALEDYPAFFTEAEPLLALATSACQETNPRLRSIYIEAYKGGYIGFRVAAQLKPREILARVVDAKTRTREQNLLLCLQNSAANLAQRSS